MNSCSRVLGTDITVESNYILDSSKRTAVARQPASSFGRDLPSFCAFHRSFLVPICTFAAMSAYIHMPRSSSPSQTVDAFPTGIDHLRFTEMLGSPQFKDKVVGYACRIPLATSAATTDTPYALRRERDPYAAALSVAAHGYCCPRPTVESRRQVIELQRRFDGKSLILGIDRMDYVKGIPHKLIALEKFLQAYPQWGAMPHIASLLTFLEPISSLLTPHFARPQPSA